MDRLARIIFGENLGLDNWPIVGIYTHTCRAAADALNQERKNSQPTTDKKKYIKCDYTGNMFIGTDTPGHTLFLECCITNGYTGR